jgi:hypothetical protein
MRGWSGPRHQALNVGTSMECVQSIVSISFIANGYGRRRCDGSLALAPNVDSSPTLRRIGRDAMIDFA